MSQEKLAELAGMNYKYLGKVELAKADPGADVLVRLARALMVPVGEIFDTISPMNSSSYRLSPSDLEHMSSALAGLSSLIARIAARQPPHTPLRARRGAGR